MGGCRGIEVTWMLDALHGDFDYILAGKSSTQTKTKDKSSKECRAFCKQGQIGVLVLQDTHVGSWR